MEVTIEGKIDFELAHSLCGKVRRKIMLDKPIPFTMDDGSVKYLDYVLIPDDMDSFMEKIFDRYIDYKEGKATHIKITMELDDDVLIYPPDYRNPLVDFI